MNNSCKPQHKIYLREESWKSKSREREREREREGERETEREKILLEKN